MCQLLTLEGTCLYWRVPLGPSKCAGIIWKHMILATCLSMQKLVILNGTGWDINILKNHIWEDFPRTDNSLSKCHKCLIFNFLVTYALTNCYNIVLNQWFGHCSLSLLVKYLLVASFLVVNFSSELSRPAERVAKKGGGANFGMLKLTFGGFSNSMTLKDETVGSKVRDFSVG